VWRRSPCLRPARCTPPAPVERSAGLDETVRLFECIAAYREGGAAHSPGDTPAVGARSPATVLLSACAFGLHVQRLPRTMSGQCVGTLPSLTAIDDARSRSHAPFRCAWAASWVCSSTLEAVQRTFFSVRPFLRTGGWAAALPHALRAGSAKPDLSGFSVCWTGCSSQTSIVCVGQVHAELPWTAGDPQPLRVLSCHLFCPCPVAHSHLEFTQSTQHRAPSPSQRFPLFAAGLPAHLALKR
jgi:hypothetical protein